MWVDFPQIDDPLRVKACRSFIQLKVLVIENEEDLEFQ